jgi:triosephosphate isomerase
MKRFLIVGNWKMNGQSAVNADLLGALLHPSPACDRVDMAVKAIIKSAKTGKIGDGKIFVTHIEEAIRIRTEERGENAV